MRKFIFYYEELIGGNKHCEIIEAENFRAARNKFFEVHKMCPHRINAIWDQDANIKLK